MKCCKNCPLLHYCLTQKKEWESCNDMLLRYNAGLLLPPERLRGEF